MSRPTKKQMEVYQRYMREGAEARAAGVAYADCPYLYALTKRSGWLQGWMPLPAPPKPLETER